MKITLRNILLLLFFTGITITGCKKQCDSHTCHITTQFSYGATAPPAPVYYDTVICANMLSTFLGPDYNHTNVQYSGACACNYYDISSCTCN